jgi:hypothetical protein
MRALSLLALLLAAPVAVAQPAEVAGLRLLTPVEDALRIARERMGGAVEGERRREIRNTLGRLLLVRVDLLAREAGGAGESWTLFANSRGNVVRIVRRITPTEDARPNLDDVLRDAERTYGPASRSDLEPRRAEYVRHREPTGGSTGGAAAEWLEACEEAGAAVLAATSPDAAPVAEIDIPRACGELVTVSATSSRSAAGGVATDLVQTATDLRAVALGGVYPHRQPAMAPRSWAPVPRL